MSECFNLILQIHTPLPLQTEKQATLFLELRKCCEQLDIFDHLVFELTPAQLPLLNQRVACLHGYGEQIATLIAEIDKDIRSAAVLSNEVIGVDAIEDEAILIEDTEEKLNIKGMKVFSNVLKNICQFLVIWFSILIVKHKSFRLGYIVIDKL